jgi:hypothetical protein
MNYERKGFAPWISLTLLAFALSIPPSAIARPVSCLLNVKFFEIQPGADADKYLGSLSSQVRRSVEVPSRETWYVRPVGRWGEEDFFRLAREMRDNRIPGLDLSERWDVTNDTLAIFQDDYAIRVLRLTHTRITDAGLEQLEKLENLGYLALDKPIGDAGLKHLSGLTRLERLEIHGPQVTDKGLMSLLNLVHLKSLDISDTAVTDAGLKTLAALPKLEVLFTSRHVTDEGMAWAASFKSLRYLDVTDSSVTDAGVALLAEHATLQELSLSGTPITDLGLRSVARMKNLKILDLSSTRITPDGLPVLASLKHLEILSLPWDALAGTDIQVIAQFPRLKQVVLNGRIIPPETLARLQERTRHQAAMPHTAPAIQTTTQASAVPGHPAALTPTPPRLFNKNRPGHETAVTWSPGDIAPAEPAKHAIDLDTATTGKGMMLEVSAGRPRRIGTRGGLRSIHQAEIVAAPREPELQPGESKHIQTQDNPAHSLGEIEVGPRR